MKSALQKTPLPPFLAKKTHKKNWILLTAVFFMGLGIAQSSQAQFMLNCPPNTIVSTDSGSCDATVAYQTPFITGGPVTDTIYAFTGAVQTYIVPNNIGQITVEVWGAQGNSNNFTVDGGLGGYAAGDLAVTPGETLYVYVGGGDAASSTGGWNGGGNGGTTANCATAYGGGGGGASDIRQTGTALTNRVISGGGGGGAGGNRVSGCGRGSGGGGGGGYYGGGGGAGWPSASTVLPTGGTQTAGGSGGTSSYTGAAPQNNGAVGVLGIGGKGGDEVGSNQGGSGTALPGGAGGATTGGGGAYSANWTGQSAGGGSGYVGGVTNDSMASGVRAGDGQVRIIANVPFTLTQTAGLPSGGTFPAGSTTNAFMVTQQMSTDTCSFVLTVVDGIAPTQDCPGIDTLYLNQNCQIAMPDYTTLLNIADNCDLNPTAMQSPASGTLVSGANMLSMASTIAMDSSGNMDTCSFTILLLDTIAPIVSSCPQAQVFTPTTFDCNPTVSFMPAVFTENCAATVTASHMPGDTFPVGTTVVTYTATDSSGNSAVCSFTLTVNNPVVDNQVTAIPATPCQGDLFTLSALPGYTSYMWSTGDTSINITSTTTGWFWVDLTDGNNCTARDSILIVSGSPTPLVSPMGASLCTGMYSTYQWYQNGTLIPGATNMCFMPTTNGNFTVVVTDSSNCQGISDSLFFVGVNDGFADPGFEVYPNPAENVLHIRMNQPLNETGKIMIYDLAGRIVKVQEFDQLQGVIQLDLAALAGGTYIVEIAAPQFRGRRRIVHVQ